MEISKTCYDQAKGLEDYCGFLPIERGSKKPLVKWKDQPHLSLEQALKFNPAAIAVRSRNLLTLDYDYLRALNYAASRGIDFTAQTWHIRKTSDNWKWDDTGLDFGKFKSLATNERSNTKELEM